MKKLLLLTTFQLFILTAFCQHFNIGDKVEIMNSGGWYKGAIVEEGSGEWNGYYKVSYDGYTGNQWMKISNIRLLKGSTAKANANTNANSTNEAAPASGPRKGSYLILSYGNISNPLRLGYFTLSGATYSYYDMGKHLLGRGAYNYDAGTQSVTWLTGPFRESNWGGGFEVDRGGKTHKIRLNGVTIGTNSTDSN